MKRRVGRAMDSRTLVADSTETLLCSYLSAILLAGLVLNATVEWWWADPLAAIGIAAFAAQEGLEAWSGERDHPKALPASGAEAGGSSRSRGPLRAREHWRPIRPQRVRIAARVDDAEVVRQPFEYELAERFAVFFRRRRLALWHLQVAHDRVTFVTFPVRSRDKCGTRSGC
jgi:hypothetical protein